MIKKISVIVVCMALVFSALAYAQARPTQPGSLLDINSASKEQLMSLPGMDDITAQGIIDGRPYSDIQQLRLKSIVPPAEYDTIKNMITVGQAPGAAR